MTTKSAKNVQTHLTKVRQGQEPAQELVFDPTTGELVVQEPGDRRPSPDAMTLNQIAEDGFFAEVG